MKNYSADKELKYSKTCVKQPFSKRLKLVFKTNFRLMQVKSIAECSKHSAILSTFIKLPFVIKIFVLPIFEWPFYTGFTIQFSLFFQRRRLLKLFWRSCLLSVWYYSWSLESICTAASLTRGTVSHSDNIYRILCSKYASGTTSSSLGRTQNTLDISNIYIYILFIKDYFYTTKDLFNSLPTSVVCW